MMVLTTANLSVSPYPALTSNSDSIMASNSLDIDSSNSYTLRPTLDEFDDFEAFIGSEKCRL